MALGGAVAVVSILTKTELFILIAGFVYVVEEISVALQVAYFKLTKGKRLFKMAPIHHHFELCGWVETRIVIVFCVFSVMCVLVSLLGMNFKFY
jgi:phospho-N-acetylmuramoyl-pentapeptide-transferase